MGCEPLSIILFGYSEQHLCPACPAMDASGLETVLNRLQTI
jgi:hypothetical protein